MANRQVRSGPRRFPAQEGGARGRRTESTGGRSKPSAYNHRPLDGTVIPGRFSSTLAERLESPFGGGEAWMAVELVPGALAGVEGRVEYPPPFRAFE